MRAERIQLGQYVNELVANSEFLYFVSYQGLTVAEFSEFRDALYEQEAQCHVLKNTFVRLALTQNGVELPEEHALAGDTAVIYGSGDASAVAKFIKTFAKGHEQVVIKGGVLEGAYLTAKEAEAVADMPSKEQLQAMLLGVLQGPSRNLVSVLNQKAASIVYVIQAYKNKLEESN
jgi:large subunit ribosomal protein L10